MKHDENLCCGNRENICACMCKECSPECKRLQDGQDKRVRGIGPERFGGRDRMMTSEDSHTKDHGGTPR